MKKKKSVVMFELPSKKGDSGQEYQSDFIYFLQTLGLDVRKKYDEPSLYDLFIEDIDFEVSYLEATTWGTNGWTRDYKERKNRRVLLQIYGDGAKTNIYVPVNKEIDKDKLVKRITDAADYRKNKLKGFAEDKKNKENFLRNLFNKYKVLPRFKSVAVKGGMLTLNFEPYSIVVDASGDAHGCNIHYPEYNTPKEVGLYFAKWASLLADDMKVKVESIKILGHTGIDKNTKDGSAWMDNEKTKLLFS